jgi:drug/metabolite transporter (DMT)-like permease
MLFSGFLFAVSDCLIKALGPPLRVWDIAFYRFSFSAAILLLYAARDKAVLRGPNHKLLILRGITGSAAFLALVVAIRMIPISTAMLLFYSYPAFAAFFGALLFREQISKELLWGIVALGGVALMFDSRLEGGIVGQLLALLGAGLAGMAVPTLRQARQTNGSVIIYLYFCIVGAAMTCIPFFSSPRLPNTAIDWLILSGTIGSSLVGQLLMNEGFRYCRSFQGSLFLISEVVFVALWGFVFLNETLSRHSVIGGVMILVSIIALTRRFSLDSGPRP